MRKRHTLNATFSQEKLQEDILAEAQALGVPVGAARSIAEEVSGKVGAWMAAKPVMTENDLNRRVAMELEKYNKDLAYVYKNRGKII